MKVVFFFLLCEIQTVFNNPFQNSLIITAHFNALLMKKPLLLFVVIFISIINYGQNNFGIFAGANYSYFTDGFLEKASAERSFGIQIGVLYNLALSKTISFRPKLTFSQQGDHTKTNQTNIFDLGELDYKLTYLNTSLDFKFWDKIYLLAGPQFGFLVDQKPLSRDLGKLDSNTDFGLNLGGGFKINQLFFELGLYQGLTTLFEYENSFSEGTTVVKNGHLKLTVGYNF